MYTPDIHNLQLKIDQKQLITFIPSKVDNSPPSAPGL